MPAILQHALSIGIVSSLAALAVFSQSTLANEKNGLQTQLEGTYSLNQSLLSGAPAGERPLGFGREPVDGGHADSAGLRWDTGYFMGYQVATLGALYVMPQHVTNWSEEEKNDYSLSKWWNNLTNPRWDQDDGYINYVLHPYWGMTYYTRGRERGLDRQGAFLYSFTLSTLYETVEALFEPVSFQDMIVTPVAGSLLGYWVEPVRRDIKRQESFSAWDKTLLIATDPLGSLNTIVDEWLGNKVHSDIRVQSRPVAPLAADSGIHEDPMQVKPRPADKYYGVQVTLTWD